MAESARHPAGPSEANTPDLTRACLSPAAWLRYLIPAALGTVADLSLKAWAFPDGIPAVVLTAPGIPVGRHPAGVFDPQPIVPHILGFTTTINQGAVFGFFQGHVPLFLAFSLVALAVIIWVFATSLRAHWLVHIALGLITAGAIGNVYDRASFHAVRDMLKFLCFNIHGKDWYPYIFNIADMLLCIGVPLLILRWLFIKEPNPADASGFPVIPPDSK